MSCRVEWDHPPLLCISLSGSSTPQLQRLGSSRSRATTLCCSAAAESSPSVPMHRKHSRHPGECLEWMKYVWKIWVIILTKLLSLCSICCGGRGGRVTHRHSNISTTWLQWGVTVHQAALYGCTQCASGVLPSVMTLTMSASNYPQPARGSPTKLSCNLPL